MASQRGNIAVSVLFFLFGGPGITLLLIPWLITGFHRCAAPPLWQTVCALLLIGGGLAPLLESMHRFIFVGWGTLVPAFPTEALVVSGLYRFVRNPMYCGVLSILAGETILLQNRWMILYLFVLWLTFDLFTRFYEEPSLRKRYGSSYEDYCAGVRRWLPRLRPWKAARVKLPEEQENREARNKKTE